MDVAVLGAVEVDDGRLALRVVEEVQVVGKLREVHDLLAVEGVVDRRAAEVFAHAQAVGIVIKGNRVSQRRYAGKLPACTPDVGPVAVRQRVADGVVGDGCAVIRGELILPCGIVGIGDGFQRRAKRAGGIGVAALACISYVSIH